MNRVLFDLSVCQPIGNSKFHGGGVYGYVVFSALVNKYSSQVIAYYDECRYLPKSIKILIKRYKVSVKTVQSDSILSLYKNNEFDRLYSPLWSNSYFNLFEHNVPIILTQHGLRALEMNRDHFESFYARNIIDYTKTIIKKTLLFKVLQKKYYRSFEKIFLYENMKIITVSEHSKASIKHFYPFVDEKRINVCYSPNTSINASPKKETQEKYYLIVSANRWLKNAYRAILALDRIFQNHRGVVGKVIITGISEDSKLLSGLKNKNRFTTKGYLEREDLESLYQNAYALIYPSLNEGFGYPPIEAMKYEVPVIASSFASISEICGDAPLYVNPYSIDEICMRILELEDPCIYNYRKERSRNQYQIVKNRQDCDLWKLVEFIMECS